MYERVDTVEAPTAIWKGASWWENVQNLSGRLRGNWQLKVGGSLVAAFVVIALIIPLFYDYDGEVLKHTITAKYQAPSFMFWFGTDNFGRDVFARVLWGTRTTLVIGASSVGFALALGVPLGMLSGYWGRWRDEAMMRVNDAFMCLPGLMLALLLVSVLGSNLWNAILAIGITYIPRVVRVVRSEPLVSRTRSSSSQRGLGVSPTPTSSSRKFCQTSGPLLSSRRAFASVLRSFWAPL